MTTTQHEQDRMNGGAVWGPLHRKTVPLDDAMTRASEVLVAAANRAMWETEKGALIHSPLSDLLGALSTVVDSLVDQRQEMREQAGERRSLEDAEADLDAQVIRTGTLEAENERLRAALSNLLGALSLFRPVQPVPDPSDCSSGYPELVRKSWSDAIDVLGGEGL